MFARCGVHEWSWWPQTTSWQQRTIIDWNRTCHVWHGESSKTKKKLCSLYRPLEYKQTNLTHQMQCFIFPWNSMDNDLVHSIYFGSRDWEPGMTFHLRVGKMRWTSLYLSSPELPHTHCDARLFIYVLCSRFDLFLVYIFLTHLSYRGLSNDISCVEVGWGELWFQAETKRKAQQNAHARNSTPRPPDGWEFHLCSCSV